MTFTPPKNRALHDKVSAALAAHFIETDHRDGLHDREPHPDCPECKPAFDEEQA